MFFQRIMRRVLPPTWFAALERETRKWDARCPCGHARNLWDLGGIRYKARGNPRNLMRCPACGERTWHKIVRN